MTVTEPVTHSHTVRTAPVEGRASRSSLVVVLSGIALVTAVGAAFVAAPPALIDPGLQGDPTGSLWVTPLRALTVLAGCGTIGSLVLIHIVVGAPEPRLLRAASRWAALWSMTSLASAGLLVVQVDGALTPFAWSLRALVATGWAAGVVAVMTNGRRTPRMAAALGLSLAALVPMVLDGHSWHADARVAAVGSLLVHVVALTAWTGGLLALGLHAPQRMRGDLRVLRRFSTLALVCFVAVAVSGLVNAFTRLSWSELLASGAYGRLLATKVTLFAVVGALGLLHRRRTLGRLADGDPVPFWTVVAAELVVMAVLLGLGAALAGASPWGGQEGEVLHAYAVRAA
jgi:hypothetical protein